MLMCLDNLHKHEITSCIFVSNLTYLISSSMSGSIKVCNIIYLMSSSMSGSIKVCNITYLISSSMSGSIKVCNLTYLITSYPPVFLGLLRFVLPQSPASYLITPLTYTS